MTALRKSVSAPSAYLTGAEAARLLGVKAQTLYAYVSRGLVRSIPSGKPRGHLYNRHDVERLRLRSDSRSGREAVAASVMNFGDPIIISSITELTHLGPVYRGIPATVAARRDDAYEQVADFLWTGKPPASFARDWPPYAVPADTEAIVGMSRRASRPLSVNKMFSLAVTARSFSRAGDVAAADPHSLLQLLFAALGLIGRRGEFYQTNVRRPLAEIALRACQVSPTAVRVRTMNRLLVLYADHELAPATFVARVAASFGADLDACIVAALESSAGSAIDFTAISRFVDGATSEQTFRARVDAYLTEGKIPPGMTVPELYPDGDPRAHVILTLATECDPGNTAVRAGVSVLERLRDYNIYPLAPLGLKLYALALGITDMQAFGLYLCARSAGWIAHCLEQFTSPTRLRPRAEYRPLEPASQA